jgi:hypothetical protein
MKVVFLSFAGAGQEGHVLDWAHCLQDAGFEVIDHERFISYDLIMADLARSDATVALVSHRGGTWAAIEHTSSAYGRDTMDGTRGTWSPKPTLLWFTDPDWDASPRHKPIFPYLVQMLDMGHAVRLPDDFEAAVARAIEVIEAAPDGVPTA